MQTDEEHKRQSCNGMYSRSSWGGSIDPFILTKFDNHSQGIDPKAVVSFVIFEWHDEPLLGVLDKTVEAGTVEYGTVGTTISMPFGGANRDTLQKKIICYDEDVKQGLCNQTQLGEFLLQPNASRHWKSPIITQAVNLTNPKPINYSVKKTGYYCVWTFKFSDEPYRAVVEFRNAYGELPAAQIAKLSFYGGLTIVYAVIGAYEDGSSIQ